MLIGVSGKIGSGKDLVGKIIQYLYYTHSDIHESKKMSFETFYKTDRANNSLISSHIPEIKKFADKLKDIVCILIGCTREQLEDREFKETELGEEWWYYKFINDGSIYSTETECMEAFINYYNATGRHTYNLKESMKSNIICVKPTPRMLLQEIGTNLFRDKLHPDCWINATLSDYTPINCDNLADVLEEIHQLGRVVMPDWVITDLRFPNEAKAIKSKDGITIRINRPKYPHGIYKIGENCYTGSIGMENFDKALKKEAGIVEHESETALDDYEFDYVIENNGTIDDLIEKVKEILIKEKIL